jgi:uncharacterized protein (DUF58 family)
VRIHAEPLIGAVLLLIGAFASVPIAIVLGVLVLFLEAVRQIWSRFGMTGIEYRRVLGRHAINWGEVLPLSIEVWNGKPLPIGWLRASDVASPNVHVSERLLKEIGTGEVALVNTWALQPYERVTREFHVGSDRRGVFELGPVELRVGDILGQDAAMASHSRIDQFLVRPRVVPVSQLRRGDRWGGLGRSHSLLNEDPSRFAGVREYVPGDPVRRIHPRASARLARPMVKRFEPSRDREFLLALDIQMRSGDAWRAEYDEDELEALYVAAASVAHGLAAERAAIGLAAAAYSGSRSGFAFLPPSTGPGQIDRILDLLARMSARPSGPFERLLAMVTRAVRPGTTVVVLTGRDPEESIRHLRTLERSGCPVLVLGLGSRGRVAVDRARGAGLTARTAELDGTWRSATKLAVAQ